MSSFAAAIFSPTARSRGAEIYPLPWIALCKHPYLCSTGFRLVGRSRKEIKRALDLVGIDAIPVLLRVANYESEVLMVRIRRPLDDAAEAVRRLQRQNRATRLENHNTVDEMAALDWT
jgi:hypothetical protein